MSYMVKDRTVANRALLSCARHECSHAMIARHLGAHVYSVCIQRDGSGYCDLDIPSSPIDNLRITVSGYVGERLMGGYHPSFKAMRRDICQCDDVYEIEWIIALDGRINLDKAIPEAFRYVESYFAIPSRRAELDRLSKLLLRRRVLLPRVLDT